MLNFKRVVNKQTGLPYNTAKAKLANSVENIQPKCKKMSSLEFAENVMVYNGLATLKCGFAGLTCKKFSSLTLQLG